MPGNRGQQLHMDHRVSARRSGRLVAGATEDRGEVDSPEFQRNRYAWELFRTFDAFPCVGDGHICEFVPGWQGKDSYYGQTFGIDAGHDFEAYAAGFDRVYGEMADQACGRVPVTKAAEVPAGETFKDEDLFIDVLSASIGADEILRTVNLPNRGQAKNLPEGVVLEATTLLISGMGFEPHVSASCHPASPPFFSTSSAPRSSPLRQRSRQIASSHCRP